VLALFYVSVYNGNGGTMDAPRYGSPAVPPGLFIYIFYVSKKIRSSVYNGNGGTIDAHRYGCLQSFFLYSFYFYFFHVSG